MAMMTRSYRSIEDFERDEIRPNYRIGFCLDDLEESGFEAELTFDALFDVAEHEVLGTGDEEDRTD